MRSDEETQRPYGFSYSPIFQTDFTFVYVFFDFLPHSEHVDDTVVDSGLLVLCNAFGYPHQVPDLLLSQPHIRKEYSVMELQISGLNIH